MQFLSDCWLQWNHLCPLVLGRDSFYPKKMMRNEVGEVGYILKMSPLWLPVPKHFRSNLTLMLGSCSVLKVQNLGIQAQSLAFYPTSEAASL